MVVKVPHCVICKRPVEWEGFGWWHVGEDNPKHDASPTPEEAARYFAEEAAVEFDRKWDELDRAELKELTSKR